MGGGSCEGVCVSVSREAELRRERKNASAGVKRDIILLILLTRALWFSITPLSSYLSFPFSCFSEFSFHNQVAGPQHLPCWHKTQSGDASRGSAACWCQKELLSSKPDSFSNSTAQPTFCSGSSLTCICGRLLHVEWVFQECIDICVWGFSFTIGPFIKYTPVSSTGGWISCLDLTHHIEPKPAFTVAAGTTVINKLLKTIFKCNPAFWQKPFFFTPNAKERDEKNLTPKMIRLRYQLKFQ